MKHPLPVFLLLATSFSLAGCGSLGNPFSGMFGSGRDARVFNAQTGEYEWPQDSSKPRRHSPANSATGPVAERKGDGRYFDAVKNQWVDVAPDQPASIRQKSPPAPAVVAAPPPSVAAPPPPPPARASGIYNPSTGQIEWNSFDPASSSQPAPVPRKEKKWYWPF